MRNLRKRKKNINSYWKGIFYLIKTQYRILIKDNIRFLYNLMNYIYYEYITNKYILILKDKFLNTKIVKALTNNIILRCLYSYIIALNVFIRKISNYIINILKTLFINFILF